MPRIIVWYILYAAYVLAFITLVIILCIKFSSALFSFTALIHSYSLIVKDQNFDMIPTWSVQALP